MSDIKTCRLCGMSNYEHKHPAAHSSWLRRSTRHNVHFLCVIQRHGLGALKEIDTHTLENLTLGDITDPATLPAIEAELEERQLICAGAAVSRGILYR